MSKALKVSEELAQAAANEARLMSRSMTRQIEHWANLGRRLERSGLFSHKQMSNFLNGDLCFDFLTPTEQAVASEYLFDSLESFQPGEDFEAELKSGLGCSGINAEGQIERRVP